MLDNPSDDLLDIDQAAQHAGVHPSTIRNWARLKLIRKYRRGIEKKILYSKAEIDAHMRIHPVDEEHPL